MNRATIISRVKRNEAGLTALGLQHVSLFGSVARGEAFEASDVDLAVTLDAAAGIDLFRFAALGNRCRGCSTRRSIWWSSLRARPGCRQRSTGTGCLSTEREALGRS
jgi:predicted nucleotidyltransferase